ncbi:glycoside hydrolase family 43 protein [Alienimonas californiensis]|uniref:Xylosidase/arabinosidase n=1 Tax=Alienimonas californiensis TaxID=2527989 RepID=A0A517P964_9PLAN|nr:glycoside hydrolase family 43 protein [Alienimonas californiensis]QDT15911.1 Xylosidase/arabinosidase [Alienimonas californiensis]
MLTAAIALATLLGPRPDSASAQEADAAEQPTYTNPIIPAIGPADPDVIQHEGTYYLYPTDDGRSYDVYTSTDLVRWMKGPKVFEPDGARRLWAPDVFRDPTDGKFYLYYTWDFTVGVAVGDGPLGPFKKKADLFERAIDAEMFRDDDGRYYLYYVEDVRGADPFRLRIRVQPMASPTEKLGESTLLLEPTEPWETKSGVVNEGPVMLKRDGTYYLIYSGTGAATLNYAVGYATSDSPTGPFKKYEGNPIISRGDGVYGPGHGSVVRDAAGELWHVYHQQKDGTRQWNRFLCLDPLWFDDDGVLHGRATRGTPQPAPAVDAE